MSGSPDRNDANPDELQSSTTAPCCTNCASCAHTSTTPNTNMARVATTLARRAKPLECALLAGLANRFEMTNISNIRPPTMAAIATYTVQRMKGSVGDCTKG